MKLPSWRQAAQAVLEHTAPEINVAKIAAELGVARAITHRHLMGQRQPNHEMVLRINDAIAALAKDPEISEYLDAVYYAEIGAPLGNSEKITAILKDIFSKSSYRGYLVKDFWEKMSSELSAWDENDLSRMANAVYALRLKQVLRRIDGAEPKTTPFYEMTAVCSKQGFDLKSFMNTPDERAFFEAEQAFLLVLRRSLFRALPRNLALRNELLEQVYERHSSVVIAWAETAKNLADISTVFAQSLFQGDP